MHEVHAVRTEIAAFRAMVEMMAAEHQGINPGIGETIRDENSRTFELLRQMLSQQAEIVTVLRENMTTRDLLSQILAKQDEIGEAILAENSTIRAKSEEILFEITTACHTLQEILDQQAGSRAD